MTLVTPIYGGLLALLYLALSGHVIRTRYRTRTALGTGGHASVERAMRVHANFNEYVPLTLVLMLAAELAGASAGLAHAAGLCLLVGRLAHAVGLGRENEVAVLRSVGMVLTFLALLIAGLGGLAAAL